MKGIFTTSTKGYALFSTAYFASLFLFANFKLKPSTDFYDTMLSSIDVSMQICYYTGIFWCLVLGISGASIVYKTIKTKSINLDTHTLLFALSSCLVILQYCCSNSAAPVGMA